MKKTLILLLALALVSCASKKPKAQLDDESLYSRTIEQTQRVWFAPYVDEEGNQHEASYINAVVKSSKWSINENKTQN